MPSSVETLEFQAETRQLLRLVIHSIYSNKDIFLRELISNASDALDKLRLESLTGSLAEVDTSDLHISLEVDRDARTLTVRDNGIGMTRDDLVELIGTIAKSGTAGLLEKIKDSKDAATAESLIGQFGVGFYSAFMVADKVAMRTRRAGTDSGTRWESDGEGSYTIQDDQDLPVGTSVTLHLKPADSEDGLADYLSESKIRQIVKRYSDFIRWPIRMASDRTDADGETTSELDTLNSMKALWARSRSEVTEDEYNEFYQQISHDWLPPAETIHMRAEGTFEYEALLFIPSQAPFDLYSRESKSGVQLYVKRVFIMDDCEALMPNYLRFVKGVVDAHDLSLNVSRELLQHDRQIQGVRRRLVKKVLAAVKDMQAKDAERYTKVWAQFGRALKEGLIEDTDNTEALLELVSAASTHDPEKTTTLRQYVERMKDGQDTIYYLTGETRAMVENSPHMEAFTAKGFEVLILTDPIDEVWVDQVPAFDGHRLQSIAKGQIDLDETADGEKETDAHRAQREEDLAALLTWLTTALSDHIKQVRVSSRLTTSAACIVGDAHDVTPTLEKMYRAMGQQMPPTKRILELNPTHPLITSLRTAHDTNADDPALTEIAELIYGSALLAEGGDLPDPARFTRLLTEHLTRTL
ncbi:MULTISPECIES: molecular chaperone HtpG [Streptomyces]|uniref:Chaperone protein HtpG n=1 Tax=Streptomyces globisporus TaxID=1908 RepID=A0ABN8V391_STRGL|nr:MULTISPECIES: molecular chaperone HtpG [Streptomyces]RDL06978.1 molecular chaperone HtpG [Streptomyces sp. HB202]WSQ90033.1 molecular chaperone HtpG [Streptomyces globisporus]WSU79320.1 molecular chaperone HtpG [Streptomyces globisporus]WSV87994.1 molecular chaperone HtpG [Streptomyces globisporus]CAH9416525.1 Chaperone protein HtpG [Streptomyces globisporus]